MWPSNWKLWRPCPREKIWKGGKEEEGGRDKVKGAQIKGHMEGHMGPLLGKGCGTGWWTATIPSRIRGDKQQALSPDWVALIEADYALFQRRIATPADLYQGADDEPLLNPRFPDCRLNRRAPHPEEKKNQSSASPPPGFLLCLNWYPWATNLRLSVPPIWGGGAPLCSQWHKSALPVLTGNSFSGPQGQIAYSMIGPFVVAFS